MFGNKLCYNFCTALLCLSTAYAYNSSAYVYSCYAAGTLTLSESSFCGSVATWNTASAFHAEGFSVYNTGDFISQESRDQIARSFALDMSETNNSNSLCFDVSKWLACVTVFPYCPITGSSISSASYYPPCVQHCRQVLYECISPGISCADYQDTSCAFFAPQGHDVLSFDKGPYQYMPLILGIYVAMWVFTMSGWICASVFGFWASLNMNFPRFIIVVGGIYMVRLSIVILSAIYWLFCTSIPFICPNNVGDVIIPFLRGFESVQFFLLFALAKGWTITRAHLPSNEWFSIIVTSAVFLFISETFSGLVEQAPGTSWVILTVLLYSVVYYYLLGLVAAEIRHLRGITTKLTDQMPPDVIKPIFVKLGMFKRLYIIVVLYIVMELIGQVLFGLAEVPMYVVVLVYELPTWVLLICLGITFRPRELTPFFYMMPTNDAERQTLRERQNTGLPVIVVRHALQSQQQQQQQQHHGNGYVHENHDVETEDVNEDEWRTATQELEVTPLLRMEGLPEEGKLIVVASPQGTVEIGVDSTEDIRPRRNERVRQVLHHLLAPQPR